MSAVTKTEIDNLVRVAEMALTRISCARDALNCEGMERRIKDAEVLVSVVKATLARISRDWSAAGSAAPSQPCVQRCRLRGANETQKGTRR